MGNRPVNILLTSGGRRVALLRAFRDALASLGTTGKIICADAGPLSSAGEAADVSELVPRCDDPGYVDCLLELCRRHEVDLLVPLIDTELAALAQSRDRFAEVGTVAVASGPQTIAVSNDKRATETFFRDAQIATPRLVPHARAVAGDHAFPLFIKPTNGSSSIGSRVIGDLDELRFYWARTEDPILLEYLEGVEYTVDVYVGLDGTVHCAVPRRRIAVRAGEVSKGITEDVPTIIEAAMLAAGLLPDARGVLTFQCIMGPSGIPSFFEINARFGGGAPLSIHAGADFPRFLIEEVLGQAPSIPKPPGFDPGVLMLRFDDAVFVPDASSRV
ncbi:ATP-grasp domain-containing protein [Lentibacter algarum]|uniref:ATP-grasp domain-containing protein n=1 Tax=Lentibacter algarum TaxID=576131 RepID=UPI003AF70F92